MCDHEGVLSKKSKWMGGKELHYNLRRDVPYLMRYIHCSLIPRRCRMEEALPVAHR